MPEGRKLKVYTAGEIARMFGVSRQQARLWMRGGRFTQVVRIEGSTGPSEAWGVPEGATVTAPRKGVKRGKRAEYATSTLSRYYYGSRERGERPRIPPTKEAEARLKVHDEAEVEG